MAGRDGRAGWPGGMAGRDGRAGWLIMAGIVAVVALVLAFSFSV